MIESNACWIKGGERNHVVEASCALMLLTEAGPVDLLVYGTGMPSGNLLGSVGLTGSGAGSGTGTGSGTGSGTGTGFGFSGSLGYRRWTSVIVITSHTGLPPTKSRTRLSDSISRERPNGLGCFTESKSVCSVVRNNLKMPQSRSVLTSLNANGSRPEEPYPRVRGTPFGKDGSTESFPAVGLNLATEMGC